MSRPPRLIEPSVEDAPLTDVTRLNVFVLGRVSHHLNTFPSGHVAVSVAAARRGQVWPAAGVVLGVVAAVVPSARSLAAITTSPTPSSGLWLVQRRLSEPRSAVRSAPFSQSASHTCAFGAAARSPTRHRTSARRQ